MSLLILPRRFRETHIDLLNEAGISFGIGVSGKYLVEVCRDGKVIRQPFGPKMRPNLITNAGLDTFFTGATTWRSNWRYGRVGTSTTPPANTDTALGAQTQSTSSLNTGGGNTFSNDTIAGAWTGTWVFEFAAVGAPVTLNEAGLGGSAAAPPLFTHTLFPSSVSLSTGDNLRLTYSITLSIPALVTPITVSLAAVNGFNVSGSMKVAGAYSAIFGTVNTTDTTTDASAPATGHFSFCTGIGVSPNLCSAPTTFPAVNTAMPLTTISGAVGSGALATYTNGSFTRNETFTWTPAQPSSTVSNVNCIAFMSASNIGINLIPTSAQTKANTNTLSITLSCTMARA